MDTVSTMQVIEERSRKRRIISAVTWFPPMEGRQYDFHLNTWESENPFMNSSKFMEPPMQPTCFNSDNQYQPVIPQIKTTSSDTNITEYANYFAQHSYSQHSVPSQEGHQANIGPAENQANAIHLIVVNPDITTEKAKEEIVGLHEKGLPLDILNEDEETPLFVACRRQNLSLAVILMELGANPCTMNKQYSTCLHQAVHNFDQKMVEELLKWESVKADIDEVDFLDRTPLMITAMEDVFSCDIADLLVNAGAEVSFAGDASSPQYRGRSPLHYASLYGNTNMIRFLINKGANLDAMDREDCTPLFLAARAGRLESVEVLVEMGASQRFTDQTEKTPYQIAIDNKWTDIIDFFHSRKDTIFVARPAVIKPKLKKKKKVVSPVKTENAMGAGDRFKHPQTNPYFQPTWHQQMSKMDRTMPSGQQWCPNPPYAFSRPSRHDDGSLYYPDRHQFVLPKHEEEYAFM